MSRSYRRTNIIGNGGLRSEKQDKRFANRKLRRKVKVDIIKGKEDIFPLMREVSNVWSFRKDGKVYFGTIEEFVDIAMSRAWNRHDEEFWRELWKKMKRK